MILRIIAVALTGATVPSGGGTFPPFSGYVVDQADVLRPRQEGALTQALGATQRVTGHQVAVVTVRTLGGQPIDRYATQLGNRWGVGRRGIDDGVLLVVAPNERHVRIAVGDGLRSVLTNAEAARIIDERILPRFRNGQLAAGILTGTAGIFREVSRREVELP